LHVVEQKLVPVLAYTPFQVTTGTMRHQFRKFVRPAAQHCVLFTYHTVLRYIMWFAIEQILLATTFACCDHVKQKCGLCKLGSYAASPTSSTSTGAPSGLSCEAVQKDSIPYPSGKVKCFSRHEPRLVSVGLPDPGCTRNR
jgi:hypothetical protein